MTQNVLVVLGKLAAFAVLTAIVALVRSWRARQRRAQVHTGGTATCRAVLSVGGNRFRTGDLAISGARAVWRSRRGDEIVDLTGGRVIAAREATKRRARPDDVLLQLTLPGRTPARVLINENDAPTLVEVLENSEVTSSDTPLPPFGPPRRSLWAILSLLIAGLWVAAWVWLVVGGDVVTATVTGGDGDGLCDVTWSSPAREPQTGQVDCDNQPAGSQLTVWALGWPAGSDAEDPAATIGGVLLVGAVIGGPGAVRLAWGRLRRRVVVGAGSQVPPSEPARVPFAAGHAPPLSIDDVRAANGESPAAVLGRLAPYAARQLAADGWERRDLPSGAGPIQAAPRALRALAIPACLLAASLLLAWVYAGSWYVLATTTSTSTAGTSTGDMASESHWPLPDVVTVRFQTSDRVVHEADVSTLEPLPRGHPVTVEYSLDDPASARLIGPGDGLGRGAAVTGAAVAVLLAWCFRRARRARAEVLATREAEERPPNPALAVLTGAANGTPVLLACAPVVSPFQIFAVPLQAPLPHGVAARFAGSPGLEVRLRGRLAERQTVVVELAGNTLRSAGQVWLPRADELVGLLDSVGALVRSLGADSDRGDRPGDT